MQELFFETILIVDPETSVTKRLLYGLNSDCMGQYIERDEQCVDAIGRRDEKLIWPREADYVRTRRFGNSGTGLSEVY